MIIQVRTLAIPFDSGIREIKIVGTSTAHQPTQPNGTSNPGKPTTKGSSDQRILSTNTDKLRYGPGEIVQVFGKLYNAEGKPDSGKVIVQVVDKSNPKVVVIQTSALATNGTYDVGGLNIVQPGNYYINALLPNSTEKSWAEFRIVEPLYPNTLIPLIALELELQFLFSCLA